jgi:hypothetical protein
MEIQTRHSEAAQFPQESKEELHGYAGPPLSSLIPPPGSV